MNYISLQKAMLNWNYENIVKLALYCIKRTNKGRATYLNTIEAMENWLSNPCEATVNICNKVNIDHDVILYHALSTITGNGFSVYFCYNAAYYSAINLAISMETLLSGFLEELIVE